MLYDASTDQLKDLGFISSLQVTIYRESLIPISGDYSLYVFFDIPCHILGVSQVVVMSMKCKSFFFFLTSYEDQ